MSETHQLTFHPDKEGNLRLPQRCGFDALCYEDQEVRKAVAAALEQTFYALAMVGIDLRALDGVTLTRDCRASASSLQHIPEGQIPLEMSDRPETMEMARTVAVCREDEWRFHIVVRAGLGLMTLSADKEQRDLAYACLAHEAAHVEHEGHLYRTFPSIYGCPLECGTRSRQTFLKALDVWSEYAACRSSAMFRPAAMEEFEGMFCRSVEDSFCACKERIAAYRSDRKVLQAFADIQQIFGDLFICAGYFLGHLDGLELNLEEHAPRVSALLHQHPAIENIVCRLERVLHELWLNEYGWKSVEVFAPIYDLICEMMALHGFAFARNDTEWRIVMCEDDGAASVVQDALKSWMTKPGRPRD